MAYRALQRMLHAISRRKAIERSFKSPLRRCLVFWDLLLLGIGGSVDVGLYVALGNVIRDVCGASVIISLTIGFAITFISGLCYAEFASYVPTSGSDYGYVYSTLGELWGFFDGWSILVAAIVATSALAQGAADLLSALTNQITYKYVDSHVIFPKHALLATNMNIVAMTLVALVTIITAVGVHSSIRFNDGIVVINLVVILFTAILGFTYIDFDYWSSWEKFAPYNVDGILKSLPYTVFFYGGFVAVTYSTEEVINPDQVLPRSIIASLFGIFVCYLVIGFVLSLVVPFDQLSRVSPLTDAFAGLAFKQSKYIIAFGGFCSCFSSVLTASYGSSRLLYVMARDGLLAEYFQKVNKKTLVPVQAVFLTGLLAAFLAAFIDLTVLIEACSILSLLPYSLLCISVILLRYQHQELDVPSGCEEIQLDSQGDGLLHNSDPEIKSVESNYPPKSLPSLLLISSRGTKHSIKVAVMVLLLSSACLSLVIRFALLELPTGALVCLTVFFTLPLVASVVIVCRIPYQHLELPFTMPLFPVLPSIGLAMCTFIMFQFSFWAWILFGGNTIFGLTIYLGYGVKNSKVDPVHVQASDETEEVKDEGFGPLTQNSLGTRL